MINLQAAECKSNSHTIYAWDVEEQKCHVDHFEYNCGEDGVLWEEETCANTELYQEQSPIDINTYSVA